MKSGHTKYGCKYLACTAGFYNMKTQVGINYLNTNTAKIIYHAKQV